jgi:hypothetical protein
MKFQTWLLVGVVAGSQAFAEKVKVEPGQRWVVLEAIRTKTLAAEISEVAAQGFRIRMSSADSGSGRMEMLLERVATAPDVFQYELVATASEKTKEKEMNEAGTRGFRVVPNTFMAKKGMTIFNTESVVLMEKEPKSTKTYEYKMIGAYRSKTMEKEVQAATSEGWELRGLAYGELIMERGAERK